jgi:ferredoxin
MRAGGDDQLRKRSAARGIPEESIRFELFKNDDIPTGGDSFEVELAKSGKSFSVPSDKSLLKACWENGVTIEASCEQGVCGTCMTGVLSGDLEHHDTYLSKAEREMGSGSCRACRVARTARSSWTFKENPHDYALRLRAIRQLLQGSSVAQHSGN